jgi:isoleucyl-tRNA synthetase
MPQRRRREFWKGALDHEKQAAFQVLYHVLVRVCQLLAPVMPFITEHVYQSLVPAQRRSPWSCGAGLRPATGSRERLTSRRRTSRSRSFALPFDPSLRMKSEQPLQ